MPLAALALCTGLPFNSRSVCTPPQACPPPISSGHPRPPSTPSLRAPASHRVGCGWDSQAHLQKNSVAEHLSSVCALPRSSHRACPSVHSRAASIASLHSGVDTFRVRPSLRSTHLLQNSLAHCHLPLLGQSNLRAQRKT